ncbi:GntR family transcriptional regulator [Bordetella ansorpii]|uniref:GntR family transcriptional regulator n=1 Tax=Bordetella ansorpii TaxID=288768 RepID=A0A146ADI7_9BORD|nr:GntR family transcriptional regulator [Bordetella ansorpii]CZZ87053.1 GntR family transcriptional regulator [Bordetella ansorpii]SAI65497.1 GntR family transcriptional regulator [Bordetella ansorpii]
MPGGVMRSPSTHRTRADDVYALVKRAIADFRLLPGDRFTEGDMAQRLGVSRTPVRQALFRLQQEGFVEVMFRSGWRVLPFDFARFDAMYDLRRVLESEAVRRLCSAGPDIDPAALDGLQAIWLCGVAERCADMAQVSVWDEAFHCTLVAAAGNDEMARVHRELTERIRIIRRLDFTKQSRVSATYDEHGAILRAILARQADEACGLLGEHIAASQAEVRKITLHEIHLARLRG